MSMKVLGKLRKIIQLSFILSHVYRGEAAVCLALCLVLGKHWGIEDPVSVF